MGSEPVCPSHTFAVAERIIVEESVVVLDIEDELRAEGARRDVEPGVGVASQHALGDRDGGVDGQDVGVQRPKPPDDALIVVARFAPDVRQTPGFERPRTGPRGPPR